MFGDSSKGVTPSIQDSRQITELAAVFNSPEKVAYLHQGKSVDEITRLTQPLSDLLGSALIEVLGSLREISGRLSEEEIDQHMAASLLKSVSLIKKQADSLHKSISLAASGSSDT